MTTGVRAVVAVMLPREHLPYIREWCRNNAEHGWDTVLYDNTGSVGSRRETCTFNVKRWNPAGDDARGNHYLRHTEGLTDSEVQQLLREEVRGLPVTINPWHPRDEHGRIVFDQVEAYADFVSRNREVVEWGAFLDCDEYLYADAGYTWDELIHETASQGCDRILLSGTLYESRWTPAGLPRPTSSLRRIGPQVDAPKNIVRLSRVLRADIHYAWTMAGRDFTARANPAQYGFRHYRERDHPVISLELVESRIRTYVDESVEVGSDFREAGEREQRVEGSELSGGRRSGTAVRRVRRR